LRERLLSQTFSIADIYERIRDVPDFPKPGILFKDITPLLQSPKGLARAIEGLASVVDPSSYDVVCGIESRPPRAHRSVVG